MMSLTTSLGRPFSAESCARPVTSSRFMRQLSPYLQFASGDKKSGVDPLSGARRGLRPDRMPRVTISLGENPLRRGERLAAAPLLREVIADVRKVVHELVAEKDHRHDDRYRDDRDDECVLDKSLALFALQKLDHCAPSTARRPRQWSQIARSPARRTVLSVTSLRPLSVRWHGEPPRAVLLS